MDRLDAIRMFVRVVDSGSFSAVARESGVGQPAVSKQIAALETHLGAQLLRRTSRRLSLTDAGQDFYESAVRLLEDFGAAESRVGRGQLAPSGLVRATVAPAFGRLYIAPRLGEFFARFPDISIELRATDRFPDLIEEGVDAAIHTGELEDSGLTSRKLATAPIITVAAPRYLEMRGEPKSPSELERHECVIYAPLGAARVWGFKGKFGSIGHSPKGNFRSNDAEQIRVAVLSGIGLAHTPEWLFRSEIASGLVRLVLRDYEPDPLPISVVHAGDRRLATKVRVFMDFLVEIFAHRP